MQGPEVAAFIIVLRYAVPRLLDPPQVPSSFCALRNSISHSWMPLAAESITAFEHLQLQCLRVRGRATARGEFTLH